MAALPVDVACRVLGVSGSESGYYVWRSWAPSARAIRHDLLYQGLDIQGGEFEVRRFLEPIAEGGSRWECDPKRGSHGGRARTPCHAVAPAPGDPCGRILR